MEIEGRHESRGIPEYSGKKAPTPSNRDALQQKTTAESGECDEGWLTAFLSQKGTFALINV